MHFQLRFTELTISTVVLKSSTTAPNTILRVTLFVVVRVSGKMIASSVLVLSFLIFWCVAPKNTSEAAVIYYSLDVRPILSTSMSPDCANNFFLYRPVLTVNGTSPGPVLEADQGDIIVVNVTNYQESQTISMHWHGIHQLGSPYSDGAARITQCPLGPLQSQVYV
jgi:FtsP/CotA-like multicopper oxidase with cupredoxin domain